MAGKRGPGRPRKRGPQGAGCIDQHHTGRWRGRLQVGRKPNGAPLVREVYGATQGEVRDKLADLVRRHRGGSLAAAAAERQTLSDFLAAFLESREGQVRPRTVVVYQLALRHATAELGAVRLGDLRPPMIQALYGKLARRPGRPGGLSPVTVRLVHTALYVALKTAVAWGYLPTNPCARVRPPAAPKREGAVPTAPQVRDLLEAAREAGDPHLPLWTVAAATGARVGELTGLRWRDVELEGEDGRGTLHVRRALLAVRREGPVYGLPKSEASKRDLTLRPEAVGALRSLKDARGPRARADELVFTAPGGGPLDRKRVSEALRRAWGRTGHGPFRFHDFRHSVANQLLEAGVEVQTVAALLGHRRASITLDMYASPRAERLRVAVDALSPSLAGGPAGGPG